MPAVALAIVAAAIMAASTALLAAKAAYFYGIEDSTVRNVREI